MCVARYCWARSCHWSPGGRGLPCDRRWLARRVRPWPVVTAVGGVAAPVRAGQRCRWSARRLVPLAVAIPLALLSQGFVPEKYGARATDD